MRRDAGGIGVFALGVLASLLANIAFAELNKPQAAGTASRQYPPPEPVLPLWV